MLGRISKKFSCSWLVHLAHIICTITSSIVIIRYSHEAEKLRAKKNVLWLEAGRSYNNWLTVSRVQKIGLGSSRNRTTACILISEKRHRSCWSAGMLYAYLHFGKRHDVQLVNYESCEENDLADAVNDVGRVAEKRSPRRLLLPLFWYVHSITRLRQQFLRLFAVPVFLQHSFDLFYWLLKFQTV